MLKFKTKFICYDFFLVEFLQRGDTKSARQMAELLPRFAKFFHVMRMALPQIVHCGEAELAVEIFLKSQPEPGSW